MKNSVLEMINKKGWVIERQIGDYVDLRLYNEFGGYTQKIFRVGAEPREIKTIKYDDISTISNAYVSMDFFVGSMTNTEIYEDTVESLKYDLLNCLHSYKDEIFDDCIDMHTNKPKSITNLATILYLYGYMKAEDIKFMIEEVLDETVFAMDCEEYDDLMNDFFEENNIK